MLSIQVIGAVAVAAFLLYRILRIGSREKFLPPGPPTIPLLGNLHIFPTHLAYLKMSEWNRQYGDIYSLKIGSGTVVVIGSSQAVYEVLDKSSGLTADRPPNHFVDIVTEGYHLVLSHYGNVWRNMRKGAHEILTLKSALQHRPIQDAESVQLMYDLLTQPKDFFDSIRRFSMSVILSVTFGKRAPHTRTRELLAFFEMHPLWERILMPGSYAPVDFLPFLKYVPERWAAWKGDCKRVKKMQEDLYFGLMEETKHRLEKKGQENGSYMETVIKKADEWGYNYQMVGHLGGTLVEAGSDTTSSFTQTLILALTAFPDVQKKAHEELDRVVGQDRMPQHEDFANLPYCRAVVNEVHRWRPNAPLIPRRAQDDVIYKGYRIPKGATIVENLYGLFHDPETYDDPERFWPDRFILSEFGTKKHLEKDPGRRNNLAFGSGRRICAGFHVGSYSTAINTMNLLWSFSFLPFKDAHGVEQYPDIYNYAQALASFPNPFEVNIQPRSPAHAALIRHAFADHIPDFQRYEHDIAPEDRKLVEALREEVKRSL
ncbi:cytochrome P450 [Heliocybe sulcata]|uniref:Cytochrome P450 n=1 Tax=Heliocybe sulcata TaxID=5364 RepID=A0A5C3N083_9AGAM|nr:cytochrome P450 [Heliocybe sulcata]